jgi:hypothetical protein
MEWRVDWELFAKFAEITRSVWPLLLSQKLCLPITLTILRDDLSTVLSKAGPSLTVKVLLDTLQQTTEFELSIAKKWATPVSLTNYFDNFIAVHPLRISIQVEEILKNTSATPGRLSKTISSAFEPHMGVFVDAQDKCVWFRFFRFHPNLCLAVAGRCQTCLRPIGRQKQPSQRRGPVPPSRLLHELLKTLQARLPTNLSRFYLPRRSSSTSMVRILSNARSFPPANHYLTFVRSIRNG